MSTMTAPKKPKQQRKPAKRQGTSHNVWLPDELTAALTAYIKATRPRPTVKATVEAALEDFLAAKGFWSPPTSTDGD